jgi:hypothetical protein
MSDSSPSDIRTVLKKNRILRSCVRTMRSYYEPMLRDLSPSCFAKYRYKQRKGISLDLANPQTFDEKLLWLMLYWRHPLKSQCADKYGMRSYVEEQGFGHTLPELLGVYASSNEIGFEGLPARFALKCTHGCQMNIICKDKSLLDIEGTKATLNTWMKLDFSKVCGELHYAAIKPRIICERYLDDLAGDLPCDYKVYCFDGRAHCTMACTGRSVNGTANFDIYDREWKNKLPYSKSSLLAGRSIPKPPAYGEIIEAAERLSRPFPFVRMDFYSINGSAVVGEMTFTPSNCIDMGYTDAGQRELGALIRLPEKRLK